MSLDLEHITHVNRKGMKSFTGTIQVKDLLSVGSTGSVEGDVSISKLIVESGAIFNAKSSMKDQNESAGLKKITNFSDSREKTA